MPRFCKSFSTADVNHALQRLARTALCEVVGTVGNHRLHALCPTHARCELSNEVLLNLSRIGVGLAVHVLIDRTLRSLEVRLLDGGLQLVLGRLHQGRVESATHLQRQSTLCTCSLQLCASLVDGLYVAADDQLTRVVIVGAHHHVSFAVDACADFLYLLVGQTDDGSHR